MNDKEIVEQFTLGLSRKLAKAMEEGKMDYYATVKIKNAPINIRRYTVCRVCYNELYFYGTYEDRDKAEKAADEINGIIVGGMEM